MTVASGTLVDIRAHCEVDGLALLTRDETRYRKYFPTVELLTP